MKYAIMNTITLISCIYNISCCFKGFLPIYFEVFSFSFSVLLVFCCSVSLYSYIRYDILKKNPYIKGSSYWIEHDCIERKIKIDSHLRNKIQEIRQQEQNEYYNGILK